mmetsp:Transcript_10107/g.17191  ORF Transcript_10107/g.17191 Transcript_10107/m.17191 type:complete len:200 (-) Transcript_10107:792-1391(-)
MRWFRESALVPSWSRRAGSFTSGRRPDQAASTSLPPMCAVMYRFDSFRINWTSWGVGRGSIVISLSESVVPPRVPPSQGRKKSTRPSEVSGTIRPILFGQNWSGSITCTPAEGTTRAGAPGSSIWRTWSEKHPVQFTTARAATSHSSPVSVSRTRAPSHRPSAPFSSATSATRLATAAPSWSAVRATTRFMRVSFIWPS